MKRKNEEFQQNKRQITQKPVLLIGCALLGIGVTMLVMDALFGNDLSAWGLISGLVGAGFLSKYARSSDNQNHQPPRLGHDMTPQ